MVALIGASGSGKSTLLRHMAGLVAADRRPDGCRVEVLGALVQQHGQLARGLTDVRTNVGFIFQQFNLVSRLSVLTNVLLGLLGRIPNWRGNLGMFTREEKLRAMAALDRVGMADFAVQRASTLSGGQQQRVAMARALGASPDPFLMAVAVAASCAFLTPIGHKNNMLILGPGQYRFGDYWRMGLPLEVLVIATGLPAILFFWPL